MDRDSSVNVVRREAGKSLQLAQKNRREEKATEIIHSFRIVRVLNPSMAMAI